MNAEEIAKLLNTLVRYDLESDNSWYASQSLQASEYGENLRAEDVAKVFGLKFDMWKGFSKE